MAVERFDQFPVEALRDPDHETAAVLVVASGRRRNGSAIGPSRLDPGVDRAAHLADRRRRVPVRKGTPWMVRKVTPCIVRNMAP